MEPVPYIYYVHVIFMKQYVGFGFHAEPFFFHFDTAHYNSLFVKIVKLSFVYILYNLYVITEILKIF